jgi:carboxylesterase
MAQHDVRTAPFSLRAGRIGCLLLHGFTATPHDMRFLAERLHAHGYTASAVQLAGHGTSAEDLERCTWRDWYASARHGLIELQACAPQVVVVGQSMGALLALKLAVDYPGVIGGVALLSPALVVSNRWLPWIAPTLPLLLPFLGRRRYLSKEQSDIADPRARAQSPSYTRIPLRALRELDRLQHQVRKLLPDVRKPLLVIHSRQDHTCPVENVTILEHAVRGAVHAVLLNDSYHVISIDVERQRVATEVASFVERTVGAGSTPQAAVS